MGPLCSSRFLMTVAATQPRQAAAPTAVHFARHTPSSRIHDYNETANAVPSNGKMPPLVLAMLSDDTVVDPATRQAVGPYVDGWGRLPRSFSQLLSRGGDIAGGDGGVGGFAGVKVALKRKTPTAATVTVCRMSGMSEAEGGPYSCRDGLDNDWCVRACVRGSYVRLAYVMARGKYGGMGIYRTISLPNLPVTKLLPDTATPPPKLDPK
jgi:hypothetical protein